MKVGILFYECGATICTFGLYTLFFISASQFLLSSVELNFFLIMGDSRVLRKFSMNFGTFFKEVFGEKNKVGFLAGEGCELLNLKFYGDRHFMF